MTLFARKSIGVSRPLLLRRPLLLVLAAAIALDAFAFFFLADEATLAWDGGAAGGGGVAARTGPTEAEKCMKEIYGATYKVDCRTLTEAGGGKERAASSRRDATGKVPDERPANAPVSVPEGTPVKCAGEDDGVYRYTAGHLRKYPSLEVADYWQEGWGEAIQTTDCANIPRGPQMTTNDDEADCVPVVKCFEETSQAFYRYLGGILRQYPSTDIADSWVADWRNVVELISCADVRRGPAMTAKVN